MPTLTRLVWPGQPSGATRAARRPCSFNAFTPDPLLGRELLLPASLAADLADVEGAVLALNGAPSTEAARYLEPLARFLLRAEAVASSHIEGLQINVRRLARREAAEREGWQTHDDAAAAVLGNVRALERALAAAADPDVPITVDTIRSVHAALLEGTRDAAWAGVVRDEQNWIGGVNPCVASFVPPPADVVPALLVDLAAYLNSDDHPAVMQAALVHSQFETIHPFADGNGRTGRALIQLVLRRRGLATQVVPPVSLVLATQADRYVEGLMATRRMTDVTDGLIQWIELFTEALARSCRDAAAFADDLSDWERAHRDRLGRVRAGSTADVLLGLLPALPVFTIRTAAELVGRSDVAVGGAVNALVKAGVIRQITVGRRNRAFEAIGLFEAVTGFERLLASPEADTMVSPPVRRVPARPERQPK